MDKVSNMVLNEQCLDVVRIQILRKIEDPGRLTLPCEFGNTIKTNTLVNSGVSMNLMLYSFHKKPDYL